MKTKAFNGVQYVTPELSALEIKTEGVLCASEWYKNGGSGDFDYDTETDDTWA